MDLETTNLSNVLKINLLAFWLTLNYKMKIYYLVILIMRYVFLNLEDRDNV